MRFVNWGEESYLRERKVLGMLTFALCKQAMDWEGVCACGCASACFCVACSVCARARGDGVFATAYKCEYLCVCLYVYRMYVCVCVYRVCVFKHVHKLSHDMGKHLHHDQFVICAAGQLGTHE